MTVVRQLAEAPRETEQGAPPGSSARLDVPLPDDRARLVRLCARLTGDLDAAEDLAQETLYEAWRNAHKLHDLTGRTQWLAAIARNVCLRWTRARGRDLARLARPPLPLTDQDSSEQPGLADRLA